MPEISIQIDSLELHGLATFDGDQFSNSLNKELSGLLVGRTQLRSINVGAVSIQAQPGADSTAIGQHVAQAIYTQMLRATG
jgi:hypothetical protein